MTLPDWLPRFWDDPSVLGGAIGGFISAFVMFVIGEVLWKSWVAKRKAQVEYEQKRLDSFYAPLYGFYCEAYLRFDAWKAQNPSSKLDRQPFFDPGNDESHAHSIIAAHTGYASQLILRLWSEYQVSADDERSSRRNNLVSALIKEYHGIRRTLHLDYDKVEIETGAFRPAR